jgi:UDP-4-amino-4,6-dideoxy-N-acetyl-beta-L-altrosamine transaminase
MAIPYGRQTIEDDDVQAVVEALRGDWLTQGPTVAAFEEEFAAACDAPYAVAFSSGTAALHGAAFAAGVGPGDELVTSAITFAASANCGAYLGATPRFADIEPATWNVSPATVAPVVTERTRLVVPVHFAGLPAPTAELRKALPEGVRLVEDAAHALGATVDGEPVGSCRHADMAVFSLHPVKAIATGEGGMVTTRDPELAERLRLFRSHGLTKDPARLTRNDGPWYQEQQELGFNYRLTDVQSALGLSQLRKLERFIASRNEIAARYREELAGEDALELPPAAPAGSRHAYHLFVVRARGGSEARRRLYDGLREREIFCQVHYAPVYFHPWYARTYGYAEGLCPNAEDYYAGCLSLPCFPTLGEEAQGRVIAAVREVLAA